MNKKEVREFLIGKTQDYYTKIGFAVDKKMKSDVWYKRINVSGNTDTIGFSIHGNDPIYQIMIGLDKRIEVVEHHVLQISKTILTLNPMPNPQASTLHISGSDDKSDISKVNTKNNEMKFDDEGIEYMNFEDQIANANHYFIHFGIPLLDKFDNLLEIDKLMNRENFWITDWQMPYNLGGNFYVKRLIIAKLANNPNYNELIDKCYIILEQESAKNGYPFSYDRNDLSLELPYTVEYLKNVKQLYGVTN